MGKVFSLSSRKSSIGTVLPYGDYNSLSAELRSRRMVVCELYYVLYINISCVFVGVTETVPGHMEERVWFVVQN